MRSGVTPLKPSLLTVIIPIHNMEGQLEILESWLSLDSLERVHVVLIHDELPVTLSPKIDSFVSSLKGPNFSYIRGDFGSPGMARNKGLELIECNSNWISFWDSDDFPDIEKFLNMIHRADLDSKSIAVGGYAIREYGSNEKIDEKLIFKNKVASLGRNVGIWRWAFKSEIVRGRRFQDFKMGEDQNFLFDLNPRSSDVFFYNDVIYYYYQGRTGQATADLSRIVEIESSYRYLLRMTVLNRLSISSFHLRILQGQFLTTVKYGNLRTRISTLFLTAITPIRLSLAVLKIKFGRNNNV